ncbi:unnamed protein product [Sphenostylis stenocarpa]|uniref:VQ domain-containing protein n=1 Tax=Sphenostylis stenocarpa TaxID=92480 RepID=A0AA86SSV0_9FABA|nr:unnamed protein product [Sphenostylis stenocarpa]
MNSQHIPSGRSPKRELQGPRPTPLRVNKDSHKIKKPPLAPPPSHPQAPPRQPIIIYTVSPKVIHTTPSDFMSLVQRLTGSSSSDKLTTHPLNDDKDHGGGGGDNDDSGNMISPIARYAAIEMARTTQSVKQHPSENSGDVGGVDVVGHGVLERPNMFHGILSPGPASLSPIPSNFFSPPLTDPNMVSFFHDLSPVLHSSRNFMEGFIMPSPSNFVSPRTPSIDLFNNFSDN